MPFFALLYKIIASAQLVARRKDVELITCQPKEDMCSRIFRLRASKHRKGLIVTQTNTRRQLAPRLSVAERRMIEDMLDDGPLKLI